MTEQTMVKVSHWSSPRARYTGTVSPKANGIPGHREEKNIRFSILPEFFRYDTLNCVWSYFFVKNCRHHSFCVLCPVSYVLCNIICVMCPVSCATCHVSCVLLMRLASRVLYVTQDRPGTLCSTPLGRRNHQTGIMPGSRGT